MSNNGVAQSRSDISPGSPESTVHPHPVHTQGLQDLIRILTKRWKWIIGSIVVCVLLALIYTLRMKPVYQATATIELNKGAGGSIDFGLGDSMGQQGGGMDLQTDLQTETAILQGDSLALAVIQSLGLDAQFRRGAKGEAGLAGRSSLEDEPEIRARLLGGFKGGLSVKPVRGTRLIQISYESQDRKQAARIANALIDNYKTQYLQSHYDATIDASDWLTNQLSALKSNVEASEKKLTDFEKESGILDLGAGSNDSKGGGGGGVHSVVIQKLDALNTELTEAEANRIKKEAIFRLAKSGNPDLILDLGKDPLAAQANSLVLMQGGGVSNLQSLEQQQTQLKMSLADASATYGPNNRHLKEVQAQIRAMDEPIHQEMQVIIKRAQTDLQLAQQTENDIRLQFDQQRVAAGQLNEQTVEFAMLSQEASSRKRLYEDLYTKLQEANVAAGIKATNITIVDPARSQFTPIRPQRLRYMELGLVTGVFLGLITAYFVDNVDQTVSNPQEVEEITGKPVIGIIPEFVSRKLRRKLRAKLQQEEPEKVEPGAPVPRAIWVISHPESHASEAFRALRTAVMLSRAGQSPKVILVTSCIPGEGKTTISVNLGASFAQHDKKVIIIEADMRRPRMTHALDVSNAVGLSSVLTGLASCDEAITRNVLLPNLDVMPAGPHPPNSSEILGSAAFDQILEYLQSKYEIIIIDSPPALLVTDPVTISTKADAMIWVSRVGAISRPQLVRAARLIERNGMPVIGFVVNRMSSRVSGYGYDYGYEYEQYGSYYDKEDSHDS